MTFKPIPGWPNYEVSDQGEVRNIRTGRIRSQYMRGQYPGVRLYNNGVNVQFYIHQLVLSAFIGPRPEGMVIRHLDGNRNHNCLSNLTYGTPSENQEDSVRHGTQHTHKFTERQVRVIRGLRRVDPKQFTLAKLSSMFGVSSEQICRIANKRVYSWVE